MILVDPVSSRLLNVLLPASVLTDAGLLITTLLNGRPFPVKVLAFTVISEVPGTTARPAPSATTQLPLMTTCEAPSWSVFATPPEVV